MTALLSAQYLLFYRPAYNCIALVVKFKLEWLLPFCFIDSHVMLDYSICI